MDPVSLVLAALATGASAGVTAGATDAVKAAMLDAYQGLRTVLKKAFGNDEVAHAALTMYERKPTERANVEALAEHLTPAVVGDPRVRASAERVLEVSGPASTGAGSVAATVLQIHAETGGVAAAAINAPVTVHNVPDEKREIQDGGNQPSPR
jgi:hypothetical protein